MIVFEANYSKKLGLPNFSSHQYSVTIRTELNDLSKVDSESAKIHALLQSSVDREIQKTGFLPESNGNGHVNGADSGDNDGWKCSGKQRELILKIVDEHKLDKKEVDALAQDRFGKSVKALNKLEASGLIEELIEQTGGAKGKQGNGRYQRTQR